MTLSPGEGHVPGFLPTQYHSGQKDKWDFWLSFSQHSSASLIHIQFEENPAENVSDLAYLSGHKVCPGCVGAMW